LKIIRQHMKQGMPLRGFRPGFRKYRGCGIVHEVEAGRMIALASAWTEWQIS
jgi:hypothetical protein